MNIWDFQRTLNQRLLRINILNALIGLALSRREGRIKGIGTQAIGWAIINIAIAVIGGGFTRRRLDKLEDPNAPEIQRKEKRNLRNILLVNCCLNPLYILGGWRFARSRGEGNPFMRGNGYGIMIQGAILACFDTFHVWQLIRKEDDNA
ncbi:MAG: hypothetical protein RLP44_09710 [Aggregatilineales bacterium]